MILLDTDITIDLLRGYAPANVPLVTFNQKHYAAVPNLRTLQPYKKSP